MVYCNQPRPRRWKAPTLATCPSFILVAPGRRVACTADAGHSAGPDFVVHVGNVRVTLPDGREQAAMILWTDLVADYQDVDAAD